MAPILALLLAMVAASAAATPLVSTADVYSQYEQPMQMASAITAWQIDTNEMFNLISASLSTATIAPPPLPHEQALLLLNRSSVTHLRSIQQQQEQRWQLQHQAWRQQQLQQQQALSGSGGNAAGGDPAPFPGAGDDSSTDDGFITSPPSAPGRRRCIQSGWCRTRTAAARRHLLETAVAAAAVAVVGQCTVL